MAGRGSIEMRKNGTAKLVYSMGYDQHGKRIKKQRSVKAKNKTEAEKKLNQFKAEIEAGEYIAPAKMKFKDFVEEWKDKYAKKHLDARTLENYEYPIKNLILPFFGSRRLDEIKPMHIIDYMNSLEQDGVRLDGKPGGYSSATIHYHYRILRDILSRAAEWQMIKKNPTENVKRPKVTYKKTQVYTEEEARQLFEQLQHEPQHARIMITLTLTAGLRAGEVLALAWEDIDFKNRTLTINHSLQYTKTHGYRLKSPKGNKTRTISLTSEIINELKAYKKEKAKDWMQAADLWEGGERFYVFSTWHGKPHYPTVPGTWWRRFMKRTNLKYIRFHDLRHTSATILINQDVHAEVISERLGHSDIKTTMNTYGHYIKQADEAAADKFNSLFEPKEQSNKA